MNGLPENPTEREIATAVNALTSAVRELHDLIEGLSRVYVRQDLYERDQTAIRADVDGLKSWNDWAVRLVLGAVILALLGLVLSNGMGA